LWFGALIEEYCTGSDGGPCGWVNLPSKFNRHGEELQWFISKCIMAIVDVT
jgi:hypothetical protein